jgi:hypothetical protein
MPLPMESLFSGKTEIPGNYPDMIEVKCRQMLIFHDVLEGGDEVKMSLSR